jgi:hypothetical protein
VESLEDCCSPPLPITPKWLRKCARKNEGEKIPISRYAKLIQTN